LAAGSIELGHHKENQGGFMSGGRNLIKLS